MNPIEEKEKAENQEEPKEEENPKEEKNSNEPSVKEGGENQGDVLNLGAEGDSSSEAKIKEGGEENKEEEKDEEGEEKNPSGEENKEDQGSIKDTFKSISGEEENENKAEDLEHKNTGNGSKVNDEKTREKTFENVKLIYNYQLGQIRKMDNFEQIYDKFWKLLPQTFEGEISKSSFLTLYTKIWKIILPLFNYGEINKFCEGIWARYTKGKNSMSKEIFEKVIFKIAHLLSVNVNQYEYEDTLNLIYDRITCVRKYYSNGEEKVFYPSIKVSLINSLSKEEYQNCTWEVFDNSNGVNLDLFEQYDSEENMDEKNEENKNDENKDKLKNMNSEGDEEKEKGNCKVRPRLRIINDFDDDPNSNKENIVNNGNNKDEKIMQINKSASYYDTDKNIYLYSEDVFYVEQKEIDSYTEELNCHIKYELMDDNELIIYGYPTQFVLNKFINNPKELQDINVAQDSEYDSTFYITDYQPYEKRKIFLKIGDKDKIVSFLEENTSSTETENKKHQKILPHQSSNIFGLSKPSNWLRLDA